MKHQMISRYPAPSATLLRMFTDPAFHTRKLEMLGLPKYRVLEHRFDGDRFSIRVERRVPVQMPGVGNTGAEATIVHEERWDVAERRGSIDVDAQGMPLEVSCLASIRESANVCTVTFDWHVKSKLPLIGGKIEKFAIADMERRAADEERVSLQLLDQYRL